MATTDTPLSPQALLAFLDRHGIAATTHVAQSEALALGIPGAHSKNLFLKDKKGRLFLVSARKEARIDLKRLHGVIGASGRLSFGSQEQLWAHLGVRPGSVCAFAVANDTQGRVTMVLDAGLMAFTHLNFHPLLNSMTTTISRDGLLAFLRLTGHEPLIVDLPVPAAGDQEEA
jgi:Ala-tRNA(Pro) deacylase